MCARKDSSYQHESEVRAMIWEGGGAAPDAFSGHSTGKPWEDRSADDPPFGVEVPIDVSRMITEVVVGPRERPWVAELVKRVLR